MDQPMKPIDIEALIDDRPEDGVFRVHAEVFRSEDIFNFEMQHIFEGTWVFVGLECQIPNPHDFFTSMIGRQPVMVTRDTDGVVHCLLNTCRHRGAIVCQVMEGNKNTHVCPYHGWAYDSAGRNVAVTTEDEGEYSEAFSREDHNLRPAGRTESYRGFIFASLNPDVVPLDEHLGDARAFIDLAVDQSPDGIELVPGKVTYRYNGNWKMQIENSADQYHFAQTHVSYLQILGSRNPDTPNDPRVSFRRTYSSRDLERGSFTFAHGHNALWGAVEEPELLALWKEKDSVQKRVGEARFKWMLRTRNLLVFPNFQLLETASLQIRVNRPLAPDKTEITTYCIAPKGESRESRILRLRQYEEFYNPTGLATPDDMAIFDACQRGQESDSVEWHQGYMRGLSAVQIGANDYARELGIDPVSSVSTTAAMGDETIFHGPYREWRHLLLKGMAAEEARPRRAREAAQ